MPTPSVAVARTVIPELDLLHLKNWWRPVDEMLWAKLQDQLMKLNRVEAMPDVDRLLLEDCRARHEMATWCIERHGQQTVPESQTGFGKRFSAWFHRFRWPFTEDNTLFWHLVHSIDEDLLLLLPAQEVAVQALEVGDLVERNINESALKKLWLAEKKEGALDKAIQTLQKAATEHGDDPRTPIDRYSAEVVRQALHIVNEQSDMGFRQLAVNMLMRAWSGFMLLLLMVLTLLSLNDLVTRSYELPALLFLGAAGAVLANLVSKNAFLVAAGPARRYFFYYLLAKPVHGAFVAMAMYLLLKSGLLLSLEGEWDSGAPLVLGVTRSAYPYALAITALVSGFSAERVFGTAVNKVLHRMFTTADKSEVTPSPIEAASGGCPKEESQ